MRKMERRSKRNSTVVGVIDRWFSIWACPHPTCAPLLLGSSRGAHLVDEGIGFLWQPVERSVLCPSLRTGCSPLSVFQRRQCLQPIPKRAQHLHHALRGRRPECWRCPQLHCERASRSPRDGCPSILSGAHRRVIDQWGYKVHEPDHTHVKPPALRAGQGS